MLVHDGRALATWHTVRNDGRRAIEVRSFTELTKEVTEAASAEMARIAIYLGPEA